MIDWQSAQPISDADLEPELCVNLWWYCDVQTNIVQRLAGRAYALTGTDDQKLQILHALAPTDFHAASLFPLPDRFTVTSEHGELKGATGPAVVVHHQDKVFSEVYQALERDLPDQYRFVDGKPEVYRLKLPQDVLNVVTCIYEYPDGRLIPQISRHPIGLQS
jgi:hypothetical protein